MLFLFWFSILLFCFDHYTNKRPNQCKFSQMRTQSHVQSQVGKLCLKGTGHDSGHDCHCFALSCFLSVRLCSFSISCCFGKHCQWLKACSVSFCKMTVACKIYCRHSAIGLLTLQTLGWRNFLKKETLWVQGNISCSLHTECCWFPGDIQSFPPASIIVYL